MSKKIYSILKRLMNELINKIEISKILNLIFLNTKFKITQVF